jgi:hypothetical protein
MKFVGWKDAPKRCKSKNGVFSSTPKDQLLGK